jgi:hypothetical protein
VTWFNLYDSTGTEAALASALVVAGRRIPVNPSPFAGVDFIRVRSGTSAAPVNQAADRVLLLVSVDSAQAFGFSSGAGVSGTSQTPWLSNIDGGGFQLGNVAKIGVGIASPGYAVDVFGNINCVSGYYYTNGGIANDSTATPVSLSAGSDPTLGPLSMHVFLNPSATGANRWCGIDCGDNGAYRPVVLCPSGGNVGIRLTNPTHTLQLATDDAAKLTTSSWTIASDARMKKNVQDLEGGLDVISQLRPVVAEYNGVDNTPDGGRVVSFIAQEVAKILPACVTSHKGKLSEDGEETDLYDLNIHEILMHLVLAVKQLAEGV